MNKLFFLNAETEFVDTVKAAVKDIYGEEEISRFANCQILYINSSFDNNMYTYITVFSCILPISIWKNTPVTSHGYWWLTSRKWIAAYLTDLLEIKKRIFSKIWTAAPRVEKNRWSISVFRDYPLYFILHQFINTRGQTNMRRFIYERSVTNIYISICIYSLRLRTTFFGIEEKVLIFPQSERCCPRNEYAKCSVLLLSDDGARGVYRNPKDYSGSIECQKCSSHIF